MARAAKLTIVEAEEIVEVGTLSAMEIDLPGIYVDRIVPATVEKQIEILTLREETSSSSSSSSSSSASSEGTKDPARIRREKIAKRAAKELKDGYYCNLGVGMPVLAASFLEEGTKVWLQSENGILGQFSLYLVSVFSDRECLTCCLCTLRDGSLSDERRS